MIIIEFESRLYLFLCEKILYTKTYVFRSKSFQMNATEIFHFDENFRNHRDFLIADIRGNTKTLVIRSNNASIINTIKISQLKERDLLISSGNLRKNTSDCVRPSRKARQSAGKKSAIVSQR